MSPIRHLIWIFTGCQVTSMCKANVVASTVVYLDTEQGLRGNAGSLNALTPIVVTCYDGQISVPSPTAHAPRLTTTATSTASSPSTSTTLQSSGVDIEEVTSTSETRIGGVRTADPEGGNTGVLVGVLLVAMVTIGVALVFVYKKRHSIYRRLMHGQAEHGGRSGEGFQQNIGASDFKTKANYDGRRKEKPIKPQQESSTGEPHRQRCHDGKKSDIDAYYIEFCNDNAAFEESNVNGNGKESAGPGKTRITRTSGEERFGTEEEGYVDVDGVERSDVEGPRIPFISGQGRVDTAEEGYVDVERDDKYECPNTSSAYVYGKIIDKEGSRVESQNRNPDLCDAGDTYYNNEMDRNTHVKRTEYDYV